MDVEVEYENRFIRLKEVLQMTSIPKSTLMEMIKNGEFPAPVDLSTRSRAWIEREAKEWMQEKIAERDNKQEEEEKNELR